MRQPLNALAHAIDRAEDACLRRPHPNGYNPTYPFDHHHEAPMLALPPAVVDHLAIFDVSRDDSLRIAKYTSRFRAPNTLKRWGSTWRTVQLYCESRGYQAFPMTWEVAAAFATAQADSGYAYATIAGNCYGISALHRIAELPDPIADRRFQRVLQGIARTLGTDPTRQKVALELEQLSAMYDLTHVSPSLQHTQDWTVLAVSFFGAMRRSETVALDVADVAIRGDVCTLNIFRSKTDQTRSREVLLPRRGDRLCPVSALEAWVKTLSGPGPLFRTIYCDHLRNQRMADRTVCRIVQRYCAALGLDPKEYGGHSLRAGYVTDAIDSGVPDLAVALHTRHRQFNSLLRYYRPKRLQRNLTEAFMK
ncbi:MAG: tyrosine-type recombinase/integrase [bacterium]|nr:tyrosine-type recombinase/integrase [bacterium]